MVLPPSAKQPIFNLPIATKILVMALVIIWLLLKLVSDEGMILVHPWFVLVPIILDHYVAQQPTLLVSLIAYGLVHFSFIHLFTNCAFLMVFGSLVERTQGMKKFLMIFFSGVLLGGVCAFLLYKFALVLNPMISVVGASAGVAALTGWSIGLFFQHQTTKKMGYALFIFFVLSNLLIPALDKVGVSFEIGKIFWQGHLAGFFWGLAGYYLMKKYDEKKKQNMQE